MIGNYTCMCRGTVHESSCYLFAKVTQPVCPDCEKKDREIEHLAGSVRNRINDCHTQSIRVIALSQALQEIYKLAKENMWYPCSFENHEAIDREQEKWHGEDVSK